MNSECPGSGTPQRLGRARRDNTPIVLGCPECEQMIATEVKGGDRVYRPHLAQRVIW